ncbi:MAG: 6-bladed beta-propeller [Ignavibacteriaceae bacterium]
MIAIALSFVSCKKSNNNFTQKNNNGKLNANNPNSATGVFNDFFVERSEVELKSKDNIYISKITDLLVKNNNYIVGDRRGKQILLYDKSGNIIRPIGKLGKGPGEYANVNSIDINNKNEILVADVTSLRVSKYNIRGKFISSCNISGFASKILADQDDGFYLYEPISGVKPVNSDIILHYNSDGKNDFSFGKPFFETGIAEGSFRKDRSGHLYASQYFCFSIPKYSSEGEYLASIKVMSKYINPLKLKNYYSYPPLEDLNNSSSIADFALSSKYILIQIRVSNSNNFINIYDSSGNLLKSNITMPSQLSLAATGDDDLFYFIQEPGENLSLDTPNYKIIGYKIKGE